MRKATQVDGLRSGTWKQLYHANGRPAFRNPLRHADDAPFGDYRARYTDDGVLYEEGRWEHGVNVGTPAPLLAQWHARSRCSPLTSQRGGPGTSSATYHDNGQLEMVVELSDGEEQGDLVRLDREGRVDQPHDLSATGAWSSAASDFNDILLDA